jgi:hypothetical protein
MEDAFSPLRSLGETQLQIQFTLSSVYDTQAMGILALNGGLAAAAIAADKLLGHFWWLALLGLLASSLFCAFALGVRSEETGPELDFLIPVAIGATAEEIDQAIVIGVSEAIQDNIPKLDSKRRRVWWAIALLAATIIGSILSAVAW